MASPDKIVPMLPDTLPEDFTDWDGEAPPGSGKSGEWKASNDAHSFGETAKPAGQSAGYNAILESLLERPRASVSSSPAPIFVNQKKSFDWNSENPPTSAPVSRSEWEAWEAGHSIGKPLKPLGKSADRTAKLPSVADRPRVSGTTSPSPVSLKPQEPASEPQMPASELAVVPFTTTPDASRMTNEAPAVPSLPNAASAAGTSDLPEDATKLKREADQVLFGMFQPKTIEVKGKSKTIEVREKSKKIEVEGKQKLARKKWVTVSALCACVLLICLIYMTPLFHHRAMYAAKQSVQPNPAAYDVQQETNTPAPAASEPFTQVEPPAMAEKEKTAADHSTDENPGVNLSQVQIDMMNYQLTAPVQIPHGMNKQVAENGPPPVSFGAAGTDGLGGNGAVPGVFNGHTQPVIQVTQSKPLVISSGVAAGMLIQKPPPVYPSIAKSARVSGIVELHAVISKAGTVKDLSVVSGPSMLRQAAVEAVRNWRYKPYKLNNEPIEVETTIHVIFTLGG